MINPDQYKIGDRVKKRSKPEVLIVDEKLLKSMHRQPVLFSKAPPKEINSGEMEARIMQMYDGRSHLMVPNISWGLAGLHECDVLILTKSGYATEVEIKTSRSDLMRDKNKRHGHRHNHIKNLFFAVPSELKEIALKEIPERSGLIVCTWQNHGWGRNDYYFWNVQTVREPIPNKNAHKWTTDERLKLAELGCMRIPSLLDTRLGQANTIKHLRDEIKNNL